ncbi:MAG TPA: hypothetical protein DCE23_07375 [Firmicutes bacterium]|nr:hypothetical protein [Bacillota bacterium]
MMAANTRNVKKSSNKVVKKSNKKSNTGYIAFLLLAVIVFIIILISTIFGDVVQIYNNNREAKELEKRKTELLEEEDSLNSEVIKLQDPNYVARYAREKYLYTKDGEKILTIIDAKDINNKSDKSTDKKDISDEKKQQE